MIRRVGDLNSRVKTAQANITLIQVGDHEMMMMIMIAIAMIMIMMIYHITPRMVTIALITANTHQMN